jgi:hypothetical protein
MNTYTEALFCTCTLCLPYMRIYGSSLLYMHILASVNAHFGFHKCAFWLPYMCIFSFRICTFCLPYMHKRRQCILSPIVAKQRVKFEGLSFDGRGENIMKMKTTLWRWKTWQVVLLIRIWSSSMWRWKPTTISTFLWRIAKEQWRKFKYSWNFVSSNI